MSRPTNRPMKVGERVAKVVGTNAGATGRIIQVDRAIGGSRAALVRFTDGSEQWNLTSDLRREPSGE